MPDASAPPIRPSEARARARVDQLLDWAVGELRFAPAVLRPCAPDLVAAAARVQGVASLAAAHEELLERAGGSGPSSALEVIFGDDLVSVAAMVGERDHPPLRQVGLELIESLGYSLDEFDVVLRVRPGREVDYVVAGSPDPPVWSFVADHDDPVLAHPSFTDWLATRIVRAAKRRHPLRRVVVPAADPTR